MNPMWKLFGLLLLTGTLALSSCAGEQKPPKETEEEKKPLIGNLSEWMPVTGKGLSTFFAELFLDNGASETAEKKILIGGTDDPLSTEAFEEGKAAFPDTKNWYYVGITADRVILHGGNDDSIAAAVRLFLRDYVLAPKDGAHEKVLAAYEKLTPSAHTGKRGTFVSAADLSAAPYFADPTGHIDITSLLKDAIKGVDGLCGGTVYLPKGHYRVSSTFEIPSYVSLRGDFAEKPEDGTLLLFSDAKAVKKNPAFTLSGSSALDGIAVFYEGQNAENPVEYPATVATEKNGVWTVRDCYFVNSFIAITSGTAPEGMITLDNIRACALKNALLFEQHADICVFTDLSFSPKYWTEAGGLFAPPAEESIRKTMKELKSVGITLRDCDRDTYERILLDGYSTGIFSEEMTRAGFSGSFLDLKILDAETGIEAHGLDTRYGLQIANGEISAKTPVKNLTDGENCSTTGKFPFLWLLNVKADGLDDRQTKVLSGSASPVIPFSYPYPVVREEVFDVTAYGAKTDGSADISTAVQNAIDAAKKAGGGVVYFPAGVYLLENKVSVPGGVLLAGATQSPAGASDSFRGTVLLCKYGRGMDDSEDAAITVKGDNAGLNGFVVFYPENGVNAAMDPEQKPEKYAFFVRLSGKNVSAINLTGAAVSRFVTVEYSESFFVDRLLGTLYDTGVRVLSSKNGTVSRVHTNGTYHTLGAGSKNYKNYLPISWMTNGADVYFIIDTHIRERLTLFELEDTAGLLLDNCFHYGAKHYMTASQAEVTVVNGESARIFNDIFVLKGDNDISGVNFITPSGNLLTPQRDNNVFLILNMDIANVGVGPLKLNR